MKIISVSYISTNEFSDPEVWLKRISFYTGILEKLAERHQVVSIERINYEGSFERNGVQYYFQRINKKVIRFPTKIHGLVKELKPDVVIVNGLIFPLQVIQLRMKLGKKVKIILFHRSEKPYTGIKKYLQNLAGLCIDAYMFTSAEFAEQWVHAGNITDRKKIYEVLHGSSGFHPADKNISRSKLRISASRNFLWVGRLEANKDPVTVVNAFIQYLEHQPPAKLYMIFQTEELINDIRQLINQNMKAINSIQLVGRMPHNELQDWYSSMDFIISGSHHEGGGIAIAEAMSCGCIPILTNIPSFRKMTGPGKCGMLYDAGNDSELLSCLMKTRDLDLEKEKEKVLVQFRTELSFDAIAKKINNVIADTH